MGHSFKGVYWGRLWFAGFAEPCSPPFTDTKNGSAAIILALGAIWIPQNHGEDPEKRSDPR